MNSSQIYEVVSPPAGATAEGGRIAVEANAGLNYPQDIPRGKAKASNVGVVRFRSGMGQVYVHKGKVGRVLQMLATMPGGITQYDTFPWHTRLGASIHHLRQSGLAIETKREGPYRHGRYRLLTAGSLIIQAETAEAGQ